MAAATVRRSILLAVFPLALEAAGWAQEQPDPQTIGYIRREFYRAVEEEAATLRLMSWIKNRYPGKLASYPPVVQAYYASLEGLLGKHARSLLSKFEHVRRAISLMDGLPALYPDDLEIRFLRFSFYHQLPLVFGVHDRVAGDVAHLVSQLEQRSYEAVPPDVQLDMMRYILGSREPNREQRGRLERLERL